MTRNPKFVLRSRRDDYLTPDMIIKSFWASTSLALILTIPSLATFISIFQISGSLLVGAVIGFGLHFLLF